VGGGFRSDDRFWRLVMVMLGWRWWVANSDLMIDFGGW
jgi:hypothetical protein